MDLRSVKSMDLLHELASRKGVKIVELGLYKNYELRKKYSADRGIVAADRALVIESLKMNRKSK